MKHFANALLAKLSVFFCGFAVKLFSRNFPEKRKASTRNHEYFPETDVRPLFCGTRYSRQHIKTEQLFCLNYNTLQMFANNVHNVVIFKYPNFICNINIKKYHKTIYPFHFSFIGFSSYQSNIQTFIMKHPNLQDLYTIQLLLKFAPPLS